MTQTIEQLQAKVAELEEENARLRTVPMKYRRMAFNAQLQDENNELRAKLAAAQEENKRLQCSNDVLETEVSLAKDQLAKTEEQVAEATAKLIEEDFSIKGAKAIRAGEWRKFRKWEV